MLYNLNTRFVESSNKKINFQNCVFCINDGVVKEGFNIVYLDGIEVGSFVVSSIGNFTEVRSNLKVSNSMFLKGGFLIKDVYRYMGIGREVIKYIFNKTSVSFIFLYAVDEQGAVGFWKKVKGQIVYKISGLNFIRIARYD
jgi:predicted acetyltransferase